MAVKRTPSPAAQSRRDLDGLISAILDKLEADDPAWAAALAQSLKNARIRVAD